LTSGAGDDRNPIWTPDGRRIVFSSNRGGRLGIFAINADGTGSIDQLVAVPDVIELWPHSWSRDGRTLLISTAGAATSGDVLSVTTADRKVTPILNTPVIETQPTVARNGEWLAYMALRDGRPGVYVERYSTLSDRRMLSTGTGVLPVWSDDGREIYYFEPGTQQLMSVSVAQGGVFGTPKPLFKQPLYQLRAWRTYDVMPDGRFVMILRSIDGEVAVPTPMVVQNWSEELKRRVPSK
jgi:Tol biopolymer transport system component